MAGHSKWAQIKRQKGATDAKRGQLFSKIARTIILAARNGDTNPDTNPALKAAVEKARSVDMPKDNIERAIAKAKGPEVSSLSEFLYEAYGPEGVGILIEGITDSTNRTTQEIKFLLSRYEGKLANPGTVLWLFDAKAVFEIPLEKNMLPPDELELSAIDAGAESIDRTDGVLLVYTNPANLQRTALALKTKKINAEEGYVSYLPKNTMDVSQKAHEYLAVLLEKLEEHDDVQNVYTNINL